MNNQEFIDNTRRFFDQREVSLPLTFSGAGTPTINFLVKWVSEKRIRLSWTQTIFTTTSQATLNAQLPAGHYPVIQTFHIYPIGSATTYHTGMLNILTNGQIIIREMGRLAADNNTYGSFVNATEYTLFPSYVEYETA